MIFTEQKEPVLEYRDIDQTYLYRKYLRLADKGTARQHKTTYYKDFITMDIETSTYGRNTDNPVALTYSIATYIDGDCILCRTWDEWKALIRQMSDMFLLSRSNRLVCYVHNLPYEFQFMRNFFHMEEVFCSAPRKVIKTYSMGIEFRCSYKLTNMGLDRFCKSIDGVKHGKLSGEEFDYSKLRLPNTPLTPRELQYIYNDVAGLYEAISLKMERDGHNIATIPITSTGYVRRELRQAMVANPNNRKIFLKTRLSGYTYGLLRECRRGGNTHCVPVYSNLEWDDVNSMDMSSAYPAVMVQCKFPMSPFYSIRQTSDFEKYVDSGKWACLIDIEIANVKLKNRDFTTIPYIPVAKCTHIEADDNLLGDNGRIIKATKLDLVVTDIDYRIIKEQYTFDIIKVHDCQISEYDYLPDEMRDKILELYYKKTTLKDGDEYFYMKFKNLLNACFGCMLTDICQTETIYQEHSLEPYTTDMAGKTKEEKVAIFQGKLDKYYNSRNSFLSYQHGVWVTAHCRNRLQKAIKALRDNMIYCDTDSCKYFNLPEANSVFKKLNEEIEEEIVLCGKNCTVEYDGEKYTLGLWDPDGHYKHFKSMGAKKYCYIDNIDFIDGKKVKVDYDVFHITVAGLSKSKACKWLDEHGGMDAFTKGTIVPKEFSGRTTALYNDYDSVRLLTLPDGETISIGSNLVISDTTYEFTLEKDYDKLLQNLCKGVIL